MTCLGEYIKHSFNSLNYKRKEKNIIENENMKFNIFYDSFYVQNKNAYVVIINDCNMNIGSYTLIDKRVNIYIIRIKKFNKVDILNSLKLINKSHPKILIIHGFIISQKILIEKDFFKNGWSHICITPYLIKKTTHIDNNYINLLSGEKNITECDLNLSLFEDLKNIHFISLYNDSNVKKNNLNNIKVTYTKSNLYLSLESLNICRNIINNFK